MNHRMLRHGGRGWMQASLAGLVIIGLTLAGIMPASAQEKRGSDESRDLLQKETGQNQKPPRVSGPSTDPPSGEVFLADLKIELTGTPNIVNQEILYNMVITNQQDDKGREIVFSMAFSHPLPPGLKVLTINSPDAVCWVIEPQPGLPIVKCSQLGLAARGEKSTSTVLVTVANPGNVPRMATAQVMGIAPDWHGEDNTVSLNCNAVACVTVVFKKS